jgi:hypothetical protein
MSRSEYSLAARNPTPKTPSGPVAMSFYWPLVLKRKSSATTPLPALRERGAKKRFSAQCLTAHEP